MTALLPFALKNWKLLLGGFVVAGLSLMLVLAKADARHWKGEAGRFETSFNLEVAKHAVTRQSVATLEAALKAKNAESVARADAFEKAKAKSAADLAALDARYAAEKGRRSRLEALLSNPASEACRAPAALTEALEGL